MHLQLQPSMHAMAMGERPLSGAVSERRQTGVQRFSCSVMVVTQPQQMQRAATAADGKEPAGAGVGALQRPDGDVGGGGAQQQPLLVTTAAAGGDGLTPQQSSFTLSPAALSPLC